MRSSVQHRQVAIVPPAPATGALEKLRVAIVHYWLVNRRGGERVVEAMARLFPNADLFSLVVDREQLSPILLDRSIHTSLAQKLPAARRWYRHLLPIYPLLLEQFDL